MSNNKEKPNNEARPTAPARRFDSLTIVAVVAAVAALAALAVALANQRQMARLEEALVGRASQDAGVTSLAGNDDPSASNPDPAPIAAEVPADEPDDGYSSINDSLFSDIDPDSEFVGIPARPMEMPDSDLVYAIRTEGAPVRGADDAPVTIVEFSDFQCSFCRKAQPTMARILEVYGDQVRIVWKHAPLFMHKDAPTAHLASVAAANQGMFWEYHDKLFENPGNLKPDALRQYALDVGLSMQRFEDDLADAQTRRIVQTDMDEADLMDLTATPGFFINGLYLRGAKPFEVFASMINAELESLGLPIPEAARVEQQSGS